MVHIVREPFPVENCIMWLKGVAVALTVGVNESIILFLHVFLVRDVVLQQFQGVVVLVAVFFNVFLILVLHVALRKVQGVLVLVVVILEIVVCWCHAERVVACNCEEMILLGELKVLTPFFQQFPLAEMIY